jgi:tol-pal system protein YbgF
VLQQEVQALRGMVEEQGYRLDRLARDQQEQYLDLDRRMQALREGGGRAPIASPSGGSGTGGGSASSGGPGSTPSPGASSAGTEREAYAAAFDLMKQRQFDASAAAFQALVDDYPNGAYTPNAFYWLGELHLARDEDEAARQSFAQVVNLYPDHQKVPDALYKLGVAHHRLGDVQRAREYLNRVRSEFPESSAAGLAQTYLAEL